MYLNIGSSHPFSRGSFLSLGLHNAWQADKEEKEDRIPAWKTFVQLAPPLWQMKSVKTNTAVPNIGKCRHSVPCGDQVWLTWAKDQGRVQPAVFSLSEADSNVKVLLVCKQQGPQGTGSQAKLTSIKALKDLNTVMICTQICSQCGTYLYSTSKTS